MYLDLGKLREEESLEQGPQLAEQLEQLLAHNGRFDLGALSRDPDGDQKDGLPRTRERVASFTVKGKIIEIQLERIPIRPGSLVWLFSADSVAALPQLAGVAGNSAVERHVPAPLVGWKLVNTSLWRWIALILLAAALAVLSGALSRLVLLILEPAVKRVSPDIQKQSMEAFIAPLRLLLGVTAFRAAMEMIGPSAQLHLYLVRFLGMLFFFGLAWLAMRVIDLVIGRLRIAMEAKHQTFASSVLPLASRVVNVIIVLTAIAAVLSNWGYDTTTILAGLGVGGLAIALAAQKTIENLFGGVSVITDRPVLVGDLCKFDNRVGTVEDIGLRSTRIRTADRTLVTVPNAQFSSMMLENLSRRDKMLFQFTLNLRRDTRPDQVRELLDDITRILTKYPTVEEGALPVRFVGVGTYSLDLEISAYVQTSDADEFLKIQQDLLLRILDAVEAAGTALALPTQASVQYSYKPAAHANGPSAMK